MCQVHYVLKNPILCVSPLATRVLHPQCAFLRSKCTFWGLLQIIFCYFPSCGVLGGCYGGFGAQMEKVRQPGNLIAKKFLKNQALAESFWILFPHFLTSKQFDKKRKRNYISIFRNGHIFDPFLHKIPKMQ